MFLDLVNHAIKHDDRKISESEARMLAYFMDLPEKYDHKRFCSTAKTKIQERALKEHEWDLNRLNINNKIYSLITKGYLRRDEDNVIYLNHRLDKLVKDLRERQKSDKDKSSISLSFDFVWENQKAEN